ncbi:putative endoribonuclease L-PSP [Cadophora sp. MPI-SDFR-AT-0126]|nr:putative endoribonuclease L-PSP [Leotiomycetes sp. MPI-SDFR-AT-0126]
MSSDIQTIFSKDAFSAPANFSHARVFHGIIYNSGQIPLNTEGRIVGTTIEEQTEQVIRNQAAILEAAGSNLGRVLRINVYLVESTDYQGFSETYNKLIPDPKPPRGCIFVKALPAGSKIEIDLVAAAA